MIVGLTEIRGIGYMFANTILNILKIDPNQRIGYLSSEQILSIESIIKNPSGSNFPSWFLNRRKDVETGEDKHLITSDIAFAVRNDVEREKTSGSWRGYRHMFGLKVRGQRTRCTGRKGGCLIATAAFGSEMAPQVQFLREIRDNTVLQTESGSAFMTGFNQFYYSFSPVIADYERENIAFKETVKIAITPMLTSLAILNYVDIDSEEEMLGYGIGIILLNIGMYFVAPAVVIFKIRNRK